MYRIYFFETAHSPKELIYTTETPMQTILISNTISFYSDRVENIQLDILSDSSLYNKEFSKLNNICIEQNNEIIFRGRPMDVTDTYDPSGIKTRIVTLEGVENWLNDIDFGKPLTVANNINTLMNEFMSIKYFGEANLNVGYASNAALNKAAWKSIEELNELSHTTNIKAIIDDIMEHEKFTLQYKHEYIMIGIKTTITAINIDVATVQPKYRFEYGKEILEATIMNDFTPVVSRVELLYGENYESVAKLEQFGWETNNGLVFLAKKDSRFKNKSSADAEVRKLVSTNRKRISLTFLDMNLIETGNTTIINPGDMISARIDSKMYADIVVEVQYALDNPAIKNLVLGLPNEKLF